MYTVGIITSSDSGYAGKREDKSAEVIKKYVESRGFKVEKYILVPDDKKMLKEAFIKMSDDLKLNLVLSTGGTGFSPRDVTPEATKEIIQREAQGIADAIRMYSLQITKRAMLSRATSGIRNKTLIVNLPGSPKACEEALDFVLEDLKHGIDILNETAKDCARK